MEDLWPEIKLDSDFLLPKEILEKQAEFLPKISKGILFGEVVDYTTKYLYELEEYKETEFCYRFILRSKHMDKYQFVILNMFHDIEMYPVHIYVEDAIKKTFPNNKQKFQVANNEQEFQEALKLILYSEKIRSVMSSLVRLSHK